MTTHTAPRHGGNRSTILGDIVMRIRYAFRFIFDVREYAAYGDTPQN